MNTLLFDSAASDPLWLVLKASALLAVAAIAQFTVFRRASAATRHTVWTLALLIVMVLPVVAAVAPQWRIMVYRTAAVSSSLPVGAPVAVTGFEPAPTASESAGISPPAARPDVSRRSRPSPAALLVVVYLAVFGALAVRWLVERWKLAHFAVRATPVTDDEWLQLLSDCARSIGVQQPVALLRTRERNVPMAFGMRRPSIVIPSIADTWSYDRRRAVLLHELAHVVRRDSLIHTLTATTCALYWFHPAVWWTARQLRVERELACDDRAIAAGTTPRDYAEHLLEIAYSFGGRRAPALAVCMARPRQLEGRMLAALDVARNRTVPARRVRVAVAAAAALLLIVFAGVRPVTSAALVGEPPAALDPQWPDAAGRSGAVANAPAAMPAEHEITAVRSRDPQVLTDMRPLSELVPWNLRNVLRVLHRAATEAGIAQDRVPGTWEIRPTDSPDAVHLRIVELNSSSGTNVPISQLEGLTAAQLTGAGGPVQFRIRRDAGTFTFEGVIRNGVGAGTFSFAADANFPAELVKRGYSRPTSLEQYQMARHDVGLAFIDELNRQGYAKVQTADLVRAGQHGVQETYLREMGALGYRAGTLDSMITLRDHGITPSYVRQLADQGYKGLPADDLRDARDHGITPQYVQAMRDAGYGSLPMTDLIRVRDHGITPDFARELGNAGYPKLPLEQLVRIRDHGVSPEYVAELKKLGFSMAIDDVIRTRDHGVTVEFVRAMASLGYSGQPLDALIRVRDHGVTEQYVRDVKALGYDKLTLDDLVSLRDHGLTADRIRSANQRAGTRLPIDMLRSLAAGGMR